MLSPWTPQPKPSSFSVPVDLERGYNNPGETIRRVHFLRPVNAAGGADRHGQHRHHAHEQRCTSGRHPQAELIRFRLPADTANRSPGLSRPGPCDCNFWLALHPVAQPLHSHCTATAQSGSRITRVERFLFLHGHFRPATGVVLSSQARRPNLQHLEHPPPPGNLARDKPVLSSLRARL